MSDLLTLLRPVIILSGTSFLLLALDLLRSTSDQRNSKRALGLGIAGLAAALVAMRQPSNGVFIEAASGLLRWDGFAFAAAIVSIFACLFVILFIQESKEVAGVRFPALLSLLLLSTTGQVLLASSNDLLMAFVAIELVSVPSFIFAGYSQAREKSLEGALKFFIVGAFSSAVLAYGISLLYGVSGSTSIAALAHQGGLLAAKPLVSLIGVAAVFVGLSFKMGLVPFHVWVPDTFAGAPTPIAGYLSIAPKIAAVALALRFVSALAPSTELHVIEIVAVLAGLSMTVGNFMGLQQSNALRLLAYSSIAQMGYLLLGLAANSTYGATSALFFSWTYLFMNLGAFAIVSVVTSRAGTRDLKAFDGLSKRSPVLALLFALFMFGLAGVPPTAGFFAKFNLFSAAVEAGWSKLVILAAVNVVLSIGYYFKFLRAMYFEEPLDANQSVPVRGLTWTMLGLAAAGTLVFGLAPQLYWYPARRWMEAPAPVSVPTVETSSVPNAASYLPTAPDEIPQGLPQ